MPRKVEMIIGCPGTGKTTSLLEKVEQALEQGIKPNEIAYVSFSKKASNEAVERALKKFDQFSRKDFPYFKTLHSLAFSLLKLSRSEVMTKKHYQEFADKKGTPFKFMYDNSTEHVPMGGFFGDICLRQYALSKAKRITLREQWEFDNHDDLLWDDLVVFIQAYHNYKQENGILDFSDFLDECKDTIEVKLFIVDEAQDLTKQQWDFARRVCGKCEHVIIAGDDDQSIYEWAGGDVRNLLRLKGELQVLPVSYRLPKNIYELAQKLSERIQYRFPKQWKPREDEGEVQWITSLNDIDLRNKTWLLLARHGYQLEKLQEICVLQGVVYHHEGNWSNNDDYVRAIIDYERMRSGKEITFLEAENVASFIIDEPMPTEDKKYILRDFQNVTPFMTWMEALNRISDDQREYIRLCKRNGESLTHHGRVVISTIHGAKGGEADNVLVITDVSKKVSDSIHTDAETRVWYVAISRAKEKLYLLTPETTNNYAQYLQQ